MARDSRCVAVRSEPGVERRIGCEFDSIQCGVRDVILQMDNAGTVALWAEDGVSLLPDTAPIVGKKSIAGFMDKVTTNSAGYCVSKEEIEWRNPRVSGD